VPSGATINQATLELYCIAQSNPGTLTMDLHPVLRPWAELQATWTAATSGTNWSIPGCADEGTDYGPLVAGRDTSTVNTWHQWDVTGLVQGWMASPTTNHGLIIKGSGDTSVEYKYATANYWWALTSSPKLTIRYSTP
jgi:hypothetical protein